MESNGTIDISRGSSQECILSPLLFDIYPAKIFRETLERKNILIKVNGKIVNNIRYANDTTIVAGSISGL